MLISNLILSQDRRIGISLEMSPSIAYATGRSGFQSTKGNSSPRFSSSVGMNLTYDVFSKIQTNFGIKFLSQKVNFLHELISSSPTTLDTLTIAQTANIHNSLLGLCLGARVKILEKLNHPYLRLGTDFLFSRDEKIDHVITHNDDIMISGIVDNDFENTKNVFMHFGLGYEMELKNFKTYFEFHVSRNLTQYEFKTSPQQFVGSLRYTAMSYGLLFGVRI